MHPQRCIVVVHSLLLLYSIPLFEFIAYVAHKKLICVLFLFSPFVCSVQESRIPLLIALKFKCFYRTKDRSTPKVNTFHKSISPFKRTMKGGVRGIGRVYLRKKKLPPNLGREKGECPVRAGSHMQHSYRALKRWQIPWGNGCLEQLRRLDPRHHVFISSWNEWMFEHKGVTMGIKVLAEWWPQ